MREIKFRAWDKHRKEMFIPSAIINPTETELAVLEGGDYRLDKFRIGEYFLMQFTGLKDLKEKEIYEGDIIKGHFRSPLTLEHNIEVCPPISPDGFHWYSELEDMDFEIIGNIYENPELLK